VESRQHLSKARQCLADAESIFTINIAAVAAAQAYLAAFHAAEAYIVHMTNRVPETHRGVRSEFSRLVHTDGELGVFAAFLAGSYELKSVADYDVTGVITITEKQAEDAIAQATRMIALVADRLG
jgi:uncharacterized protein (UPF0332 family)